MVVDARRQHGVGRLQTYGEWRRCHTGVSLENMMSSIVSTAATGKDEVLLSERGSGVELDTATLLVTWSVVSRVSSKSAVIVVPSRPGNTPVVQLIVPAPPGGGVY